MENPAAAITPERVAALERAFDFSAELPLAARLELLGRFRGGYGPDPLLLPADELVVRRCVAMARHVRKVQDELRETIARLSAPPHFPAVLLDVLDDGLARVSLDGAVRVIALGDGLADLQPGEPVLVSAERNFVVGRDRHHKVGDLASFERLAAGGLLVVGFHAEELLCRPVNGLQPARLRKGDTLLIDPANRLAIDKVDDDRRGNRLPYEVETLADLAPAAVGGLDAQLTELLDCLLLGMCQPDRASAFRLTGLTSILLSGPPGTGKTLLAKVAAAELRRRTGAETRFISIRPGEWKSEWVGRTERAIRQTFASIRQLAADGGFAVVFMDEVEGFGRTRGRSVSNTIADDFTNALLAELDGFHSLANVALISATNRKDLIDPALRERLAGIELNVPRPKLAAARAILGIHLRADDPWLTPDTRTAATEAALALLYAPAAEAGAVARIRFNDGSSRVVRAADLASGRLFQQIGAAARRRAACRPADHPDHAGLTTTDVLDATEAAIDGLRATLSRDNASAYLADLPQDLAVVAVEPLHPRPARIRHYLNP